MDHGAVILRFDDVCFDYGHLHPILEDANFSIRENAKLTIVGQNGAGKSTIFKMMTGELKPTDGEIHLKRKATIGIAKQVVSAEDLERTVQEFFETAFNEKKYDIERDISRVLDVVNLVAPRDKKIAAFSGGQKARLLLAYAIIQEPDILLLDEPTNNLDKEGIEHLTSFLVMYPKTCIVISHDAGFLNSFTHGVLHLDHHTKTVQQYVGDYFDVVEEIAKQIERDQRQNTRMQKSIADRKDKINFFANKGGKMRKLASKMRDDVADAEASKVDVRREEKTIPDFTIEMTPCSKTLADIKTITVIKDHEPKIKKANVVVRKQHRVRMTGPNGIGKTTLLESLANRTQEGATIDPEVNVGYYRQDFSGLDFTKNVYDTLAEVMDLPKNEEIYKAGARFLLTGETMKKNVGALSEGQKGLLCFARFTLQRPTLLILDEPTNHINFRHLPVIAKALNAFEGGMIIVSHDQEFMDQITINEELNLGLL